MATCKECLHWEACSMIFREVIGRETTANGNRAEQSCSVFKDRTKYVEQKPIVTNNDLLNSMSVDEKAKFMPNICYHARKTQGEDIKCVGRNCTECLKRWLEQPADKED